MPSLFHLDWYRCLDGYRIEERQRDPSWGEENLFGGEEPSRRLDERNLVPNSSRWERYELFKIPAAYRQFADWDGSDAGLLKLINAFGFLQTPKKTNRLGVEPVFVATQRIVPTLASLVEQIERQDWESIADLLKWAVEERSFGIGHLSVIYEISGEGRPDLKLQPNTLGNALIVQALADATLGVEHRKCKTPECDRYFPISGDGALRSDAEYHDEACRRRHAYLLKKANLKRKERRR